MAGNRINRISSEYMQALASCMRDVKDPRLSGLVSITRCEVTNDLRYARVNISVLGDDDAKKNAMKGLRSAAKFLRYEVAQKIGLRAAPEPMFFLDESISHGVSIMQKLQELENAPETPSITVTYSADEAASLLKNADDLLILTHIRPDGDTLGSASALCLALRAMDKNAYILSNSGVTPKYAWLVNGLNPPTDFVPATVISVDVADKALLPENAQIYVNRVDLAIDHHGSNRAFSRALYCKPDAAACGELILGLIDLMEVEFDADMADAIYTAVSTDTGCFRFSNTTAETFNCAARCIEAGADAASLNYDLFIVKTKKRAALEGTVYKNIEYFAEGRVSLVRLTLKMREEMGLDEDDLDGFSSLARDIEGVDIGITATEQNGKVKFSIRADTKYDAGAICSVFNGGGHRAAAGYTVEGDFEAACAAVVAECVKLFNK